MTVPVEGHEQCSLHCMLKRFIQTSLCLSSCLQVYLVNVTFNLLECRQELTPGMGVIESQPLLPVWCVQCTGTPGWSTEAVLQDMLC